MRKEKSNTQTAKFKLVPYQVIEEAVNGYPEAIYKVLDYYDRYIITLATRHYYDESGNNYYGLDEEIYIRLKTKLMQAILLFRL
ncbi:MAG: helix-turn-helix domain-containing protein [Clostridiales bacterium]|nr:helix-turn-helix domain-containing protein [Clostridiales bacterium]